MKLYYSPAACSLASNIIAHEAGLPVELVKVDLATHVTDSGKDFYTINPKGYVPVLEISEGVILTEGVAILQYLADQKPEANLIPKAGTMDRYHTQEWLTFISSEIHKGFSPLWNKDLSTEAREAQLAKLHKRLEYLEKELNGKNYILNDMFGVADAYLFTVLNWAPMLKVDVTAYPNINAFSARVMTRPCVQEAMKAEGLLN